MLLNLATQVIQHAWKGHFRVPGLEATPHRGLYPVLRVRIAHAIKEEVRVATEVLLRRECDLVDPVLDGGKAGSWEAGYPMSQRLDEIAECCGGQRSIDPAAALRRLRIVIVRAQQHLDSPTAAHEASQMLDGTSAGDQPESYRWLTENRGLARSEAHVTRQYELAAHTSYASFDLGNRD